MLTGHRFDKPHQSHLHTHRHTHGHTRYQKTRTSHRVASAKGDVSPCAEVMVSPPGEGPLSHKLPCAAAATVAADGYHPSRSGLLAAEIVAPIVG